MMNIRKKYDEHDVIYVILLQETMCGYEGNVVPPDACLTPPTINTAFFLDRKLNFYLLNVSLGH